MATTSRINVLVYSGNGTTVESVRHCLYTLRRLLSPNYAVVPVTSDMIIKEPWTASCAAIVIPGGADLAYCSSLNGAGNRRIRQFVEAGGLFIGFCAGGYYGSKRCEFEVGNKPLEVIGDRELAFYPGISRGCAFSGFVYHSEKGARAVDLKVDKSVLSSGSVPGVFKSYYNGGGVFVDAPKYKDQGVEVLATYADPTDVDSGQEAAAIVHCRVGKGAALLTGPHPEFVFLGRAADDWSLTKPRFASAMLKDDPDVPGFSDLIKVLASSEKQRVDFLKACLAKLGFTVSQGQDETPSLSRLHLSSENPANTTKILEGLAPLIEKNEQGEDVLRDDNDVFNILKSSQWNTSELADALPRQPGGKTKSGQGEGSSKDLIVDYNSIVKEVLVHEDGLPTSASTPYFNHQAFYTHLEQYKPRSGLGRSSFGSTLLYGEVITSTNTILEKNTKLIRALPHGFTATATVQVAGRGRGSNVWVSPAGSLMFSTVIRHPMAIMRTAPVVFVQYLAAMAVVNGVKSYDHGQHYNSIPVKLKWPNDIYALDPVQARENGGDRKENYVKIGGILVNSHYNSQEYIAVCGIGLNTANSAPSISLNQLLPPGVPPFTIERLLARILATFEELYTTFLVSGFDDAMEQSYYKHWLHMDQIVTLEAEGGQRAQIKGITKDYGLLIADELGWDDQPTGKRFELQSDSNSFDFFRGLVKRKT